MQETQAWSLGQEDPLEKEVTTHSSILTWKIPWTEEPGGQHSMGSQELEATKQRSGRMQSLLQGSKEGCLFIND